MEKTGKAKYIIGFIVFTFVFAVGIRMVYDALTYTGYAYPVYFSEKVRAIHTYEDYTNGIRGQLKNLTDKDVVIEKIHFYLSGRYPNNHDTIYYDDKYLYNIVVPANGTYEIDVPAVYDLKAGCVVKEIIINGKLANIQYSEDGKTFSGPDSLETSIIVLCVGLFADIAVAIFYIKWKKQ